MKYSIYGKKPLKLQTLKERYVQSVSKFTEIDGVRVHYCDQGNLDSTVTLVLLHGFGAHLYTFDAWVASLSQDYRIIRVDLPGFGLSDRFPNGDYGIQSYLTFLNKFLVFLNIESCVIGGNSMGGNIAWNFTLDYPEKVEKLVLIDAAGYHLNNAKIKWLLQLTKIPKIDFLIQRYTPDDWIHKTMEQVYGDASLIEPKDVQRYADLMRREGATKAMLDISRSLDFVKYQVDPRIELLKEIQQPILILWGELDEILPVADAKRFYKNTPNSTLKIIEGAGHAPMEERPKESLIPLEEFLAV